MNDPFVGSLTFCRIYSGVLEQGSSLLNSVKDKRERVGRMMQMHSNSREDIKEAYAGDIVAIAGLKETTTGDTLCDPLKPVILERMEFPEPVIEIAVEPKTKGDQEKMASLLTVWLPKTRPSACVDEESGQTIIAGHGRASPRHSGRPHEARVQGRSEYRSAAGGLPRNDHQDRRYRLHPQEAVGWFGPVRPRQDHRSSPKPIRGFVFESTVVGGNVPKEYIPGVEKGIQSVMTPVRLPASRCSTSRRR
jgi:elongation factor G